MKRLLFLLCFCVISLQANYSWTPETQLSDPTYETDSSSVAVDSNGNAVAVWRAFVPPNPPTQPFTALVIQAATKLYGQPWSAPEIISPIIELTSSPMVHVDSQGNAVAMWITYNMGQSFLRSATKLFGQPWSASDQVTGSSFPGVANFVMDPNGNVTAIWYSQVSSNFIVYASERSLLGAWPATPTTLSTSQAIYPQIGIDANGNVTATWEDSQNIVFARKPFGSLIWGPVMTVYGGGGAFAPMISVNREGDAAIIWSGYAGVAASYIPFNQAAQPPQTFPGSSTNPNSRPNIGLDNAGNAIAIWYESNGNNVSSIKLSGQPWGAPSIFASPGSDDRVLININACNVTLIALDSVQVASGVIGSSFSPLYSVSEGSSTAIDQSPCGYAMIVWQGNNGTPSDTEASEGFIFPGVTSFYGFQKKNDFGTLSEYQNHLYWTRTPTQNLSGFQIYRNGSPIATVKANENKYIDLRQKKNVPVQYGITVIDSEGGQTSQTFTTVP
jgi:hypothetical protein